MRRLKTVRRPPIYPKTPGHLPCSSLTHPLPLSSRRPSVSFGGFGLKLNEIFRFLKGSLIMWPVRLPGVFLNALLRFEMQSLKPYLPTSAITANRFSSRSRKNAIHNS